MEEDPAGTRECEGQTRPWGQPRPGDLVEIFRPGYQHWAVYVGGGDVVHMTTSRPCCVCDKAVIKKHKLSRVIGISRWRINNALDRKCAPRAAGVIVEEALTLVGTQEDYSIVWRNCEHLATELRYGRADSGQVGRLRAALQTYSLFFLQAVLLHGRSPDELLGTFGLSKLKL
ncbi:unnamed protein product [Arctogadus glacialis]